MPNKTRKGNRGASAPKQPEREQVQEWEDEGGATKPSAQQPQEASSATEDQEPTEEPRGRSGGRRPVGREKSRSRTGR